MFSAPQVEPARRAAHLHTHDTWTLGSSWGRPYSRGLIWSLEKRIRSSHLDTLSDYNHVGENIGRGISGRSPAPAPLSARPPSDRLFGMVSAEGREDSVVDRPDSSSHTPSRNRDLSQVAVVVRRREDRGRCNLKAVEAHATNTPVELVIVRRTGNFPETIRRTACEVRREASRAAETGDPK